MSIERKVHGVLKGDRFHWVGDGFRVSNYFPSGNALGNKLSPFFLMDYHPPFEYAPSEKLRGVGSHPHRGFETVTIAFEGSVAHHDSTGMSGIIGPGDVQWMTAASGILHKEYHEQEFSRRGGTMHMMQLWVNLPKSHKMDPPGYQALVASEMGRVALAADGGEVTVIAGEYQGVVGPAKTMTPINLWQIALNPDARMQMAFPARENTALLVLDGDVRVNGSTHATKGELVLFANEGDAIALQANTKAHVLLLNGEPIDEPVVQYGPFVMNTQQEIREAIADFNAGKFGQLE